MTYRMSIRMDPDASRAVTAWFSIRGFSNVGGLDILARPYIRSSVWPMLLVSLPWY